MLRSAIIGCGKIADAHALALQRIPNCRIVGVCDREELMARQLRERFPIDDHFSDVAALLDKARPDVVHITTPPQSHFALAKQALEAGCHVYVEKPFTLHANETVDLIALAEKRGLKITAGHDDQFSPAARRLRELVRDDFLGGRPLHLESYYGYPLNGAYVKALLGDKQHWVRRLPGGLLQNVISHGIARIAEYLPGTSPAVHASGFTSAYLQSLGENELIDELRVLISDEQQTTAYFTFSSQMRPSLHQLRVYGTRNGAVLDEDHQTLIRLKGRRLPSFADRFLPPVLLATDYLGNVAHNAGLFLARRFHMKSGMKYLIEQFYLSIIENRPVPIPYRELLLTARLMDSIFSQLPARRRIDEDRRPPEENAAAPFQPE